MNKYTFTTVFPESKTGLANPKFKRYSTAQKQVTTLTRDSRDESRVSRKKTLVSRKTEKTVSTSNA